MVDLSGVVVFKRNGSEESFSRSKLLFSLVKACDRVQNEQDTAFALMETIEAKLIGKGLEGLKTSDIAAQCTETLSNFHKGAAMRYRSYQVDYAQTSVKE